MAKARYIGTMTTPPFGMPWRRLVPLTILVVSLGSLAPAYAAQYVFGLEPCALCLYQRLPYVVTAMLGAAALILPTEGGARTSVVALSALVFAGGAALAFYHVGVEEHWWASIAGCGGELATSITLEDLRAGLNERPPKPCDQVDWRLFGLSLAGYNVAFSLFLAGTSLAGARMLAKGAGETTT